MDYAGDATLEGKTTIVTLAVFFLVTVPDEMPTDRYKFGGNDGAQDSQHCNNSAHFNFF